MGVRDENDVAAPVDPPSREPNPETSLDADERQHHIQEALGRLSPEDRSIVLLRETESSSYEDIAVHLGLPLGTVKSRLARARWKLRDILKDLL